MKVVNLVSEINSLEGRELVKLIPMENGCIIRVDYEGKQPTIRIFKEYTDVFKFLSKVKKE